MNWVDQLQWPAMVVTLGASWLVASAKEHRRRWGFWIYFLSNGLWIMWGVSTQAWALIALQLGLLVMNIRGARRNGQEASS